MAYADTVRNINGLVEEGVRRMLRVTRKGIRRESLAEYALFPIEDGSTARGPLLVSTCVTSPDFDDRSTSIFAMRNLGIGR